MVIDGIRYALALIAVGLVAFYLGGPLWTIPEVLFAAFVLYFFRDPNRTPPAGALVVSPADGKVVDVKECDYEGRRVWKISIFLNIFNVHVNRSPIAGVVRDVKYSPGKFLVASRAEASFENEQNTVVVDGERFSVTYKQIAGLIARRIVCTKKVGDSVGIGDRVGLIKFGSRVDLFLPLDLRPTIAVGDHVCAGETVLAVPAMNDNLLTNYPPGTEPLVNRTPVKG